jgi:hypothetical protein
MFLETLVSLDEALLPANDGALLAALLAALLTAYELNLSIIEASKTFG